MIKNNSELLIKQINKQQDSILTYQIKESTFNGEGTEIFNYKLIQFPITTEGLVFRKKTNSDNTIPLFIVIFCLLLILFPRLLYKAAVQQISQSIISFKKFQMWLRDVESMIEQIFPFTLPAFFLIFTQTIDVIYQYLQKEHYIFSLENYTLFLMVFLIFFTIRHLLVKISSVIFETQQISKEYISNIFLSSTFLAILLIPLNSLIITNLSDITIIFTIAIILFTEIYRITRGFLLAMQLKKYAWYYYFMYFCSVEIIPFFIIYAIYLTY